MGKVVTVVSAVRKRTETLVGVQLPTHIHINLSTSTTVQPAYLTVTHISVAGVQGDGHAMVHSVTPHACLLWVCLHVGQISVQKLCNSLFIVMEIDLAQMLAYY